MILSPTQFIFEMKEWSIIINTSYLHPLSCSIHPSHLAQIFSCCVFSSNYINFFSALPQSSFSLFLQLLANQQCWSIHSASTSLFHFFLSFSLYVLSVSLMSCIFSAVSFSLLKNFVITFSYHLMALIIMYVIHQ